MNMQCELYKKLIFFNYAFYFKKVVSKFYTLSTEYEEKKKRKQVSEIVRDSECLKKSGEDGKS